MPMVLMDSTPWDDLKHCAWMRWRGWYELTLLSGLHASALQQALRA